MKRIAAVAIFLFVTATLWAHESGFPEATLKKVFPDATGFTVRKKTLKPAQLARAEQLSGSKVQRNDNPLVVYVAMGKAADGSGILGTVVILDTKGPKGAIDLAVGFDRAGAVQKVVVVENGGDAALSSASFLNQLKGKSASSSFAVGKDIQFSGDAKAAQALAAAVHRGLYLLEAAGAK